MCQSSCLLNGIFSQRNSELYLFVHDFSFRAVVSFLGHASHSIETMNWSRHKNNFMQLSNFPTLFRQIQTLCTLPFVLFRAVLLAGYWAIAIDGSVDDCSGSGEYMANDKPSWNAKKGAILGSREWLEACTYLTMYQFSWIVSAHQNTSMNFLHEKLVTLWVYRRVRARARIFRLNWFRKITKRELPNFEKIAKQTTLLSPITAG